MLARAPNPRVQAILMDVARTWTRLALEAEEFPSEKGQVFPFHSDHPR
jgi:hypothetical protein